MANFVKTKISVSLTAVAIMVLLALLANNFNAAPSFTRWSPSTSWDSFHGVPKPFSRYDASISSTIHLDYNSATRQYYAYAAQNNNYSWAKSGVKDSAHHYLLNHEQYHFNITEVHARLMNEFIQANPGLSEDDYRTRLHRLLLNLEGMQDAYDQETNHSVNRSIQRRWEYRIDSLLQIHAGNSGVDKGV